MGNEEVKTSWGKSNLHTFKHLTLCFNVGSFISSLVCAEFETANERFSIQRLIVQLQGCNFFANEFTVLFIAVDGHNFRVSLV